mmetsp:Transcript_32126/g.88615  ORF Transcript_32126/g.88615 Transcript_32126/m.88615 type:complete len:209 (-) Transcript_32126:38-664(-)
MLMKGAASTSPVSLNLLNWRTCGIGEIWKRTLLNMHEALMTNAKLKVRANQDLGVSLLLAFFACECSALAASTNCALVTFTLAMTPLWTLLRSRSDAPKSGAPSVSGSLTRSGSLMRDFVHVHAPGSLATQASSAAARWSAPARKARGKGRRCESPRAWAATAAWQATGPATVATAPSTRASASGRPPWLRGAMLASGRAAPPPESAA